MTASLTSDQVASYQRDGILFPVRAMAEAEAAAALRRFESLEAREGGKLGDRTNEKPHILIPWLSDLVRHPKILDAVESILGPNILCWASGFFAKNPSDGTYISWHQDSTYWGLSSPEVLTAWVALTTSNSENGCLQVIPTTHTQGSGTTSGYLCRSQSPQPRSGDRGNRRSQSGRRRLFAAG